MAARPTAPKSIPQVATELWELSIAYAKQETIDPFRGLTRFLKFGLSGAAVLGLGCFLMLLGLLRFLQTQTDTALTGNLSWVPYLVVALVAAGLMALAVWRIVKRKGPGL